LGVIDRIDAVCPLSNMATVRPQAEPHPLGLLYRAGFNVTPSTDNPITAATTMPGEARIRPRQGRSSVAMKMRALVKHPDETGLRLEEVPVPEPGPDDVLIRVLTTGICGTDLHIYNWDDWARATVPAPMTVGHEFSGEIVGLGPNVSGFEVGELVGAEGHVVCNRCRNCLAGRRHLCHDARGIGVNLPGAFADYVLIPKSNVWRHHEGLDPEIAALFDPFGNAVHTALEFPVLGEDVLITGAGPIGLMAIPVVVQAGARNVVITDVNPFRLDLAKLMGATRTVDIRTQDLGDVQIELGLTEGFDVALEMSGSPSAMEDILQNTIHGANVAILGIPADPFPIDWGTVIFNMLNLKGIYGREMFETWYKMNVLIESGVDISPVITHRFEVDEYEAAFDATASHESGKVLIRWADRS
jgi:threonine 3-dehydrogenase